MKKKLIMPLALAALTAVILTGCTGNTNKNEETLTSSSETSSELKDSLTVSIGSGFEDGNFDPCTGYGIYGYGQFPWHIQD